MVWCSLVVVIYCGVVLFGGVVWFGVVFGGVVLFSGVVWFGVVLFGCAVTDFVGGIWGFFFCLCRIKSTHTLESS